MDSPSELRDWIKPATMTALQSHVTSLGICPFCHKKTLGTKFVEAPYQWMQCAACGVIFVLECE